MTTTSGHQPDLAASELLTDPYGGYDRLREQGPVLRGRYLDGSPVWYVTRFADVHSVLGDPRFVNNVTSVPGITEDPTRENIMTMFNIPAEYASYLSDSILSNDPPDHARLRKLVSRAFTVRRVGELRPRVAQVTSSLLDGLEASAPGPVDLVERFAYPLPITVICELVGIPESDRPAWREWGRALAAMSPDSLPVALREIVANVSALVETRREHPTGDLVSALIRVRDEEDGRLSESELITFVLTLVLAGHETTAHLIGNSVVALLTHPDQLELLRREPSRWPTAVHELMRWCGPVHLTRLRYAATDVELAGVRIRKGDAVQPVLVSANFDPRSYAGPERLDVTRQPAGHGEGHLGFGHGAHYCLGAALARQEAEVALRALFDRFPRAALAVAPEQLAWQPRPGSRRLAELPVRLA